MGYKWKPSKKAKQEFAQKMKTDTEFAANYSSKKNEKAQKRRSASKFDYSTAGGYYIPTKSQYEFCMNHVDLFKTLQEKNAANLILSSYVISEKVHHDHIHIVNEKIRSQAGKGIFGKVPLNKPETKIPNNMKINPKQYKEKPEILLFGIDDERLHIDEIDINIKRTYPFDYKIKNSTDIVNFLRTVYTAIDLYEEFYSIYLDTRNKIIGVSLISRGGIYGSVVDIRLILGIANKTGARSIIISHNHPSGNTNPSEADTTITKKIMNASSLHDITLLDHLIITSKSHFSFADHSNLGLQGIDKININNHSETKNPNNMKMITKENFKEVINSIDTGDFPETITETIKELRTLTSDFTDWSLIDSDKDLAEIPGIIIDYVNSRQKSESTKEEQKTESVAIPANSSKQKKEKKQRAKKEPKPKKEKPSYSGEYVETVMPEVRIIKRYVAMDGKKTTKEKILSFIKALQNMIRTLQIRKTSQYATEIQHIQKELIKIWMQHKANRSQFMVELSKSDAKVLEAYRVISNSQKPMQSIRLIKRFLTIQGKEDVKEKAQKLRDEIQSINSVNHKYHSELVDITLSLNNYLEGKTDVPEFSEQVLNGLLGLGLIDKNNNVQKGDLVHTFDGSSGRVVRIDKNSVQIDTRPGHYYAKNKVSIMEPESKKCNCKASILNGIEGGEIINSTDFANLDFKTIGFTGKWLQLIGDPSEPWALMIWSKPGKGKSSLMIEFAKYIAQEHNRSVLFVANEEGLNYTLKDKFIRMNAIHPMITIADALPSNLSDYDYVFIDSVTSFKLATDDLEKLMKRYPSTNFMFIFQSTVDGNYRGDKEAEHLVDVSIYINENGYATAQKTRFGGKGTINVFPQGEAKVYKFTNLQDAEKFSAKQETKCVIVQGDDGKIWVTSEEKALEMNTLGFQVIQ